MYYTSNLTHMNSPSDLTAVKDAHPSCRHCPLSQCKLSAEARSLKAKGTAPT